MKSKPFFTIAFSFFIGIFVASFVQLSILVLFGLCCACFACFATIFIKRFRQKQVFLLILSACIAFSLGAMRFQMSETDVHLFDDFIGKKTSVTGIICAEPEDRELTQKFCFQPHDSGDRILVSAGRFPRYWYGDELVLTGKLELPDNFEAYEGGPEFDYVSYLQKDSIRYLMSRPQIRKTGEGKGSFLIAALISIKSAFMSRVEAVLPEPHASIVAGLLLGVKSGLPQDVNDDFKKSGLTHVLVLSGSNVTVVAESLLNAFAFLPRTIGQGMGALSIVLFALMTGASATTVRATIMALVLLMARGIGRRYDVIRALMLAAVGMLLHNPRILAFDISFQLSFLATLAIIYVSPLIKAALGWMPERFGVRETLAMTIASQIFTLPFILYKMGEISVIALVPNLLVLPIVPYVMLGGFVSGVLGFIHPFVAMAVAVVTRLALAYMIEVVAFFGQFPFATTKIAIGWPWLFVSYILYALAIWRLNIYLEWRATARQQSSAQRSSS